jgi:hypothetical protein
MTVSVISGHNSFLMWLTPSVNRLSCYHLAQGLMLLFAGPVVDYWVSGRDVLSYTWTRGALQQLMLSCGVAVAVNISQFMCLGRFSAVTFQVCGSSLGSGVWGKGGGRVVP